MSGEEGEEEKADNKDKNGTMTWLSVAGDAMQAITILQWRDVPVQGLSVL